MAPSLRASSSCNESEMGARKTTQADVAARLPLTVPVAAEKIVVRKRPVTTGTVRVRKILRERIVNVDEPLVHQDVVIERRRVERLVETAMRPRREGDILVIPVMEEVLLTRFRVIEEIRIHLGDDRSGCPPRLGATQSGHVGALQGRHSLRMGQRPR